LFQNFNGLLILAVGDKDETSEQKPWVNFEKCCPTEH